MVVDRDALGGHVDEAPVGRAGLHLGLGGRGRGSVVIREPVQALEVVLGLLGGGSRRLLLLLAAIAAGADGCLVVIPGLVIRVLIIVSVGVLVGEARVLVVRAALIGDGLGLLDGGLDRSLGLGGLGGGGLGLGGLGGLGGLCLGGGGLLRRREGRKYQSATGSLERPWTPRMAAPAAPTAPPPHRPTAPPPHRPTALAGRPKALGIARRLTRTRQRLQPL